MPAHQFAQLYGGDTALDCASSDSLAKQQLSWLEDSVRQGVNPIYVAVHTLFGECVSIGIGSGGNRSLQGFDTGQLKQIGLGLNSGIGQLREWIDGSDGNTLRLDDGVLVHFLGHAFSLVDSIEITGGALRPTKN